jgi:NAD(P)-dependent dehydrogenase (short-subunit alcohol dehydrogenase family)
VSEPVLNTSSVIVTGAGSGIGRTVAVRLASLGARVTLAGRTAEPLETAAREITDGGGAAAARPTDLRDPASVEELVESAVEQWGRLTGLVNSAGVFLMAPLLETSPADFEDIIRTNLEGAFLAGNAAARAMMETGGGSIIHISSNAGLAAYPNQGAYCASKHGLMGLAKVQAAEWRAKGVKVSAIAPGCVDTPMSAPHTHVRDEAKLRPDDVADAVVFLLTQSGRAHTFELVIRRFLD